MTKVLNAHTPCPRCHSQLTRKRGKERLIHGWKQRYQCISCGRFFQGELKLQEKD